MKDKLLIIGASGHGKVVADVALKMNRWKTIAFLDDDSNKKSSLGIKVIGTTEEIPLYIEEWDMFVAIGNNTMRQRLIEILETSGASIPVIIHPDAMIGEQVDIGLGSVVMAGVTINCCTQIGRACIINTGSIIEHDNNIEDYAHISPGAKLAGNVKVGKNSWIGIGAIVINNISICNDCIIGAGAVVVDDIKEAGTYIGVPARKIN